MQQEINNLVSEIKKGQDEKEGQFITILDKPVFGKKVVERRFVIDFAEIVDVNENDLIGLNVGSKKYRNASKSNISKDMSVKFLQLGKYIQNTENCTVTRFEEASRLLEECPQTSEEYGKSTIDQIKEIVKNDDGVTVVECKLPKEIGDSLNKILKSIAEE